MTNVTNEVFPLLRWRGVSELFTTQDPLLVFVKDGFDEDWGHIPDDVNAMLETMQSSSIAPVRIYVVDFRVDPDFLELFGLSRETTVVRRMVGSNTFDMLDPALGFAALIDFCRPLFDDRRTRRASGEILAAS
jgi:hypothetical protein